MRRAHTSACAASCSHHGDKGQAVTLHDGGELSVSLELADVPHALLARAVLAAVHVVDQWEQGSIEAGASDAEESLEDLSAAMSDLLKFAGSPQRA